MTRVLITGARAPAALHLARLMDGAGHHVVMADSLRRTVGAASKACAAFVPLPAANGDPVAYGRAVKQAVADHDIDLVIPTCEEVFHLAALWSKGDMGVPLFAPPLGVLARAHSKFAFVELARSLDLGVPRTRLLTSQADLAALDLRPAQLVFKPVWSRFATRVKLRPKAVTIVPSPQDPWVAQDFVSGTEVCVYAVAHAGEVTALAAYRPVYRAGGGAGIAFLPDTDPQIATYVRRFVQGTGWTGQVSFDMIRKAGGDILAIECNPRATSGIHFFRAPAAFAKALLSGQAVQPDVNGLQAVKAALALYGPFQRPLKVWQDLRTAQDVMFWPDDPAPARAQWGATREVAAVAARHRIGLVAATTHDIAWNGD
ncbi:MAG: hypothetical protein NWQ23_04040 [Yoonia sp.]|uniref:hypothetical protein n=1 Tax=Yoonia sp. TaxID=2212373 RepID=UPI00273E7375|nr:hypothetical protein [Yoonia sp.]MDP5084569.1 hypothetical protein [Yoonia sp.]